MGRAVWLADRLRAAGLVVHEVPGWQTRGSDVFTPRGVVCHHTASAAGSDHPALGIVTNGRPDLAGPLCNVLLARNGDCWVVAAGRANHAGEGGWRGLTGNSSVFGIEAENNGVGEPWSANQIDAYVRLCAALATGAGFGASTVCYHREWAPSRKIDPAGPGIPQDGNVWRAAVAAKMSAPPLTQAQKLYIWLKAGVLARKRPFLRPGSENDPAKVPHIKAAQQLLGLAQTGTYGPATVAKVKAFQEFLKIPHRGPAGRMNRRTWQWLIYAAFTRGRS